MSSPTPDAQLAAAVAEGGAMQAELERQRALAADLERRLDRAKAELGAAGETAAACRARAEQAEARLAAQAAHLSEVTQESTRLLGAASDAGVWRAAASVALPPCYVEARHCGAG